MLIQCRGVGEKRDLTQARYGDVGETLGGDGRTASAGDIHRGVVPRQAAEVGVARTRNIYRRSFGLAPGDDHAGADELA